MSSTRLINAEVVLVVVLLAAWLVAAVWFDDDHGSTDGPVIADREVNGYNLAEVSGVLHREGDCLTISGDLVVWPHDTAWDETDQAVVFGGDFDDVSPLRVGERFSGGGGYHEGGGLRWVDDAIHEAVRSCLTATGSPDRGAGWVLAGVVMLAVLVWR